MCRRLFVRIAASSPPYCRFPCYCLLRKGVRHWSACLRQSCDLLRHGTPAGGTVPLTLQDGLAKGQVKVRETGSVNQLTVENVGTDEVFVRAGDIVKGGQQDRVLSVDLLLPPHSGRVQSRLFASSTSLDGTWQ